MFNLTLVGDRELRARISAAPPEAARALQARITTLSIVLKSYIVSDKLSGQVLNRRSGALSRSIDQRTEFTATRFHGIVYSSGDVKYAGIHEFGGIIQHPGGTAYIVLARAGTVQAVFLKNSNPLASQAKRTRPHPIPMPKRSFMRSSLADKRKEITDGMRSAYVGALRSKVLGAST